MMMFVVGDEAFAQHRAAAEGWQAGGRHRRRPSGITSAGSETWPRHSTRLVASQMRMNVGHRRDDLLSRVRAPPPLIMARTRRSRRRRRGYTGICSTSFGSNGRIAVAGRRLAGFGRAA